MQVLMSVQSANLLPFLHLTEYCLCLSDHSNRYNCKKSDILLHWFYFCFLYSIYGYCAVRLLLATVVSVKCEHLTCAKNDQLFTIR